jgi:phenylpyruvate tautomerase PptA (4-oxalocrotonate tautomerase family)
MPYIRIFMPETGVDAKRAAATVLTDAVQRALQIPDEARDWTTVHFIPYRPEDLAVGGTLGVDGTPSEYYIDYIDMDINQRAKDELAKGLTAALAESLGLSQKDYGRINFRFQGVSPDDIAMGGRFVRSLLTQ